MRGLFGIWVAACLWAAAFASAHAENLTLTQGTNIAAAVSPDGRQVVFDLQGTLWVMPIAGGTATPITDPLADARQPQWSPDGSRIVFQSFTAGGWEICTVMPDGTDATQLTRAGFDNREPVYSPDGQWIAFSSDRDGTYAIWVMGADGAEPRLVTITNANEFSPTWSPDGKRIAYASDRSDGAGVYSIAFEGVGERLVVPVKGALNGVSWSVDGNAISFVETSPGDGSSLKRADLATGGVSQISGPSEDVFPFRASWLPKGGVVYTADAAIKQRDLGKPKAKPISIPFSATADLARLSYQHKTFDFTSTASRPVKGIRGPQLSPDGKRAVFAALGDLWLADVTRAGTKPAQITDDAFVDYDPAWSRDGKSIAFVSDRSGKTEIWVHDVKSKAERQLTHSEAEVQRPSWSPNGTQVAFFKAQGLAGLGGGLLNVADVATGETKQIHGSIFAPSQASWSPDGKSIVVSGLSASSSRFREGFNQFMVIAADGSRGDKLVTPYPGKSLAMRGDDGPVWSPDGKFFAYVFDGRLWIVPVTPSGDIAGPPRRLNDELSEAPTWSGDGKSILYNATDRLVRIGLDGKTRDVHPAFTWTPAVPQQKYVLRAGKLFDGVNETYAENVDVLIEGNRIASIAPRQEWGVGIRVIDAAEKAVIPGLMESHTHQSSVFGERLGRLWLAMGITSVREPGADPYDALERREAWAGGRRLGPREFYAGALTDGARVFYGFANSITTPEHLELEMARAKALDFDMIKTYVRMPDAMQKIIVERAHGIGIPVSSHEIYPAVGYNVDTVEHLRGTSRRGYSPKQTEMGFSYGDVIDILTRTGMTVTPTIGLSGGFNWLAWRDPDLLRHPVYQALFREDERKGVAGFVERARPGEAGVTRMVAAMLKAIRQIVEQGGRITSGTDSPFVPYGLSFQAELEVEEAAGLSPYQVLLSATAWPAERLGLSDHLGTLEPGKLADLVVVDGDPLASVRDLRNISAVISNGRYFTREELLQKPH